MSKTVIFPGTFDPITYGHINLIDRALRLFDHVIVAIAADASVGKIPLFDLSERQALAKIALEKYHPVEVIVFHGLTVNCALEHGARGIVRGVRSSSDLDYEQQLATMNHRLEPAVETIFLSPTPEYMHISASLVRQIAQLQGNIDQLVPEHVVRALKRKFALN